jgi:hypothetical protein
MRHIIWNMTPPAILIDALILARNTSATLALDLIAPPITYATDDIIIGHIYEVGITACRGTVEWHATDATTWRSWLGVRRLDGDEYHDIIYIGDTQLVWDGVRECGCTTCTTSVKPELRHN